jgi:hypothetical protein
MRISIKMDQNLDQNKPNKRPGKSKPTTSFQDASDRPFALGTLDVFPTYRHDTTRLVPIEHAVCTCPSNLVYT